MEVFVNDKIVNEQHTLYLQKVRGGSVVDTAKAWNLYVTDSAVPLDGGESKDDGTQIYVDEHGADVFDSDSKFVKSFDVEIPLVCYGTTPVECRRKKEGFIHYMLKNGILHKVYMPFFEMGRTNVVYKSVSDFRFQRGAGCSVLSFKLKVTVNDPISNVTYSSDHGITELKSDNESETK